VARIEQIRGQFQCGLLAYFTVMTSPLRSALTMAPAELPVRLVGQHDVLCAAPLRKGKIEFFLIPEQQA
jgi:hypothetical protein